MDLLKMPNCVKLLFLSVAALVSLSSHADISPYVSLHDQYLNGRIEQLAVVSNLPSLRRPYSVAEVRKLLSKIEHSLPGLHKQIAQGLAKYEPPYAITHAGIVVAETEATEQEKILPNARGERLESKYRVSAEAQYKPTTWLMINAGGLVIDQPNDAIPVGSFVAFGSEDIQLDAGFRERWWSPFQQSAMLLSTNARPSLSVGLSNSEAFESLWNLHYEVFVARLEHVDNIRRGDELESGRPALLGTHLSFEPVEGWIIGLTRTMQFGGGSRKVDAGSVWDAFIDPVSGDNAQSEDCASFEQDNCELGNQQAAISSRMNFNGETPFSLYFEYAGEDTAAGSNKRLGNLAVSGGIYFPFLLDGNWSLRYEFSEWQNSWYTHHIYRDGYTNDGVVMGHWGANERQFGSNAGATAQSLELGWQTGPESRVEFTYHQIENANYASVDYHTGRELGVRYTSLVFDHRMQLRMLGGDDVYGDNYLRAEIGWEW